MNGYKSIDLKSIERQSSRTPFIHQETAFKKMSEKFSFPISGYRGSLLVLPTGAGKTFTAINWIAKHVLSKGIKVLWLAQSTYLLEQAFKTFDEEIHNVYDRDRINIRVVSSSDKHQNSGSIQTTDDVLICTTQTAITAYGNVGSLDVYGRKQKTPFRKYIENNINAELFVVLDEAHHSPAYGCRTFLISLQVTIPNLYLLGLTATPMHNNKNISGWLWKIFDHGICFEAEQTRLQTEQILAIPKYIEKQTNCEMEVDDNLYRRLVLQHKDLPENVIEQLANNTPRNNLIVSDYLENREKYGKTLIFTDRWFQCEYIASKLNENKVSANAVYSKVEGQNDVYYEGRGRRSNKDNDKILSEFKDNIYKVIVNVKMLTEGVDVPDVKTVMITRQTTSPILFRQMVGRALRGIKIGGKAEANIIIFNDKWKRLLPFVKNSGDTQSEQPPRQGKNPIDLISIAAIKEACSEIDFSRYERLDSAFDLIPVGWFATEFTAAIEDNGFDELIEAGESVLVYEFNKDKYDLLINSLILKHNPEWADEKLTDVELTPIIESYTREFFIGEENNIDGNLRENISNIIRHISQKETRPEFINFKERTLYDIDDYVSTHSHVSIFELTKVIESAYNDVSLPWKILYKTPSNFTNAFFNALKRMTSVNPAGSNDADNIPDKTVILTEEKKEQVRKRDHYTCVCCGKQRARGVRLEIDHIKPVAMGGGNDISNLQTLCKECNREKGTNEFDYRRNESYLSEPLELILFQLGNSDSAENLIARITNHIYYCKAFCRLNYSKRKDGKYYSNWGIQLFKGNNPDWLRLNIPQIIAHLHKCGFTQIQKLDVFSEENGCVIN